MMKYSWWYGVLWLVRMKKFIQRQHTSMFVGQKIVDATGLFATRLMGLVETKCEWIFWSWYLVNI